MWKFIYKTTDAHRTRPQDVDGFYAEQVGSKYYIYARLTDGGKKTVARYNTAREAQTAMNTIIAAGMKEISKE